MRDIRERVALGSIVASASLAAAKAAVGFVSGSLAIVSEAAHSLLDLAATVATYFAVRVSGKPADKEHQYGHGKIESVAALAETALLFVLSVVVIWAAMKRLGGEPDHPVEASVATFLVMAGSMIVDFFRARLLSRTAAATGSQALEADALHFGSDLWSSFAVLVGLAAVALGFHQADAVAAMVVAAFVCLAGWRLGKRTIDTLTDVAPEGVAERISALVRPVKGVVAVERVRARPAGAVLFVELSVAVSRTLPLERVASIKADVVRAVRAEFSHAELTVTTNPRALDNESVLERIMMIARNRGLAVHHVTVHAVTGKLSVSLDLELDGHLGLGLAHDIASRLETAIADELGPDVEVETHIEPLQAHSDSGQDASADRVALVEAWLTEIAAAWGAIGDVHDVRVRNTSEGEIVNFHCLVDPAMTVEQVHENVDEVERELRRRSSSVKRVIGHAEPRR
jgi:cation diffusion facilitator family transporter